MKALVYHGPGNKAWEEKPKPALRDPTDAIVKMERTTICGTDLHIMKGDVPAVTDGRILGHEGVGVVEEAGPGVSSFKKGDRVLISCITSCGKCESCKKGMYSHCLNGGGWILGNLANVGVHGKSVVLKLEKLWDRNITITTRLVDTVTTPMLLKNVASKRLDPKKLVTHTFSFDEVLKAYDTFGNAAKEKALKVIIRAR